MVDEAPNGPTRKHPLWHLFGTVVLLILVVPIVLWGIVQLYEIICAWCGCCEGMPRPRKS